MGCVGLGWTRLVALEWVALGWWTRWVALDWWARWVKLGWLALGWWNG